MAMPYDYNRFVPVAPFAEVDPILEFTSISDLILQMRDFAARHRQFRAGVADTSFFPFSAICKLIITMPSGTYGGTGFYIAEDLILTAGHCALDRHNGTVEAATQITIRAGQQQNGTHLSQFTVTPDDWEAHPTWISSQARARGFDLTVIRVKTPPPNKQFFTLANFSPAGDTPVAVCGYSGQDVASDRQHLDIDRVRRLSEDNEVVEYNLQTRGGGSGGPVFLDFMNSAGGDTPNAIPVMGVHVARGDATHNRGVLLTPDKINWARGGGIMSMADSYSRSRRPASPTRRLGGLPLVSPSQSFSRQPLAHSQEAQGFSISRIIDLIRRRVHFNMGVEDTSYFPYSAICRLTLDFPDETSNFQGTGFYIKPGLILTAGHNFVSDGGRAATKIIVEPGYNDTTVFPAFEVRPADWDVHPKFLSQNKSGFDMGVIRTSHKPPNGKHFHLINRSPAQETPLAISGYGFSDTVSGEIQHLDIATYKGLEEDGEMLNFDIYALGGHSGSPCFVDMNPNQSGGFDAEHIPVMAILEGGRNDLSNRGVLITPEKIDWIDAHDGTPQPATTTQSFSAMGTLGGLPLISRSRGVLGGLPLMPARRMPPAAPPMHPQPAPAPGTPTGAGPKDPVAAAQAMRTRPMSRSWIVADPAAGMSVERRTFGKAANDLNGKTTLEVIIRNMPAGGSVHWNIPDATDRTRVLFDTGSGTAQSASGTQVTLCALAPGVARVDCSVKDASGTTIESNKYLVSAPHFVKVAFDASVDTFLNSHGLSGERQRVIDEMRGVTSLLYENVNVRFVLPGDALPAHLDGPADTAFPGGTRVSSSVSLIDVTGEITPIDPEQTHRDGVTTRFATSTQGRNHQPGDLPAPLNNHNISSVMLGHMRQISGVSSPEDTLAAGGVNAANLQLGAALYGRLLGEVTSHEFAHFPHGAFSPHNTSADGLLADGFNRTLAEMTGLTAGSGGALLTDNGIAGINRLLPANLRAFEQIMPVNPPLDSTEERARPGVGSFSVGYPVVSGGAVHLPGLTLLDRAEAVVLIRAIETAMRRTDGSARSHGSFSNRFMLDMNGVLDVCDSANITLGLGTAFDSAPNSAGIAFAPGRRLGYYGALSNVPGAVASGQTSAQITVVRRGPENFGGSSTKPGVHVENTSWANGGAVALPQGALVIFDAHGTPIGFTGAARDTADISIAALVQAFGTAVWSETAHDHNLPLGRAQSVTDPTGELRAAAIAEAIQNGAPPEKAAAFANQLFM